MSPTWVQGFSSLSTKEVEETRLQQGWNELPSQKPKSVLQQLVESAKEPMIVLLIVCSVTYLWMGDSLQGLILLVSVGFVLGISFIQQFRAERALESLKDLSSPRALVVRDGKAIRIPGREVVPGDVLFLNEGDRVPADGQVLESAHLRIDESTLTGESEPVLKGDSAEVFLGSLVVGGQGWVRTTQIGASTELGKLGRSLERLEELPTRLQEEIRRLIRTFGTLGILVSVAVWITHGLANGQWGQGLLAGLAIAMSLLPEELPIISTVFLAMGAHRLSQQKVLARRLAATEALGSITVLCVDKTGTLTYNQMRARRLVNGDHQVCSIIDKGAFELPEEFHALVEYGVLASHKDPFDPTEKAIRGLLDRKLAGTEHIHDDWSLRREYPLTPELLAMSCVWERKDGKRVAIATKGAPEAIMDLCHLSAADTQQALKDVQTLAAQGLRILGVARGHMIEGDLPEIQHDFEFEWLGLIGVEDPLRPEVKDAVELCRGAGIRVCMLTGDYPATASKIALEAGLSEPEQVITGQQLAQIDGSQWRSVVAKTQVFARVRPDQKLGLVQALQANGETVAMTGDGVNDAPCLKAADTGIAMGLRGTDVAREAADLVLLDDRFASIVHAIALGRTIYINIRKSMGYIFAVHLPIAGMALLPTIFGWPSFLFPLHILFFEFIIDPACTLVFEDARDSASALQDPPRSKQAPLFSWLQIFAYLTLGGVVLLWNAAAYFYALRTETLRDQAGTIGFFSMIAGNLLLLLVTLAIDLRSAKLTWRIPRRLQGLCVLIVGALGVVFAIPSIRGVLALSSLNLDGALVVLTCAALTFFSLWGQSKMVSRLLRRSS